MAERDGRTKPVEFRGFFGISGVPFVLTISNISKAFGPDQLFSGVSLQVNRGERIGLIGPNGAGKSTFFQIILGLESPDEGTVAVQKSARFGFLPQENAPIRSKTIIELATQKIDLLEELWAKNPDPRASMANPALIEPAGESEYYQRQAKAKRILKGLGFHENDFDQSGSEFSGGWVMRAHLARLLVDEPDLLLLDEPTNHLDLDSLDWLQNYLTGYPGAMLVISHDRNFLNTLVTRIAELDRQALSLYTGNYDSYLKEKAAREEQYRAAYANQEREIKRLQTFVDRFGAKATKASQAQSKRKQIERLRRLEAPERGEAVVSFKFPQPVRSGAKVLELKRVSHAYGPKVIYREISIEIERGQRTAVVGPNGAGKTTLLKLMSGNLPVQEGHRALGYNVQHAYFSQHRVETLNLANTVLAEALSGENPVSEQTARTLLGAFLFRGEEVFKPVGVLSGGEKSRLALAKILLDPPNFLLMDEPTTHLDIASIQALVEALSQYQGTILFVSHDVHFIRSLASSVLSVREGELQFYPGDYDYYLGKSGAASAREGLIFGARQEAPVANTDAPSRRETDRERRRQEAEERNKRSQERRRLQSELEEVESQILELEHRQQSIASEMENPELHEDPKKAKESARELKEIADALETLAPKWERLAEGVSDYLT